MKRTPSTLSAVFAMALSTGLAACERKAKPQPARPPATISAAAATTQDVAVYRSYPGTTMSTSPVSIVSRVEGWLLELGFENGDTVEKGQMLYRIDPTPFQAKVDAAEASLGSAKADLAVATSEVGVADAKLQNARQEYERNRPLVATNGISEERFDRLEAEYLGAQAQVEAAKAQVGAAEAAIDSAKAQIEIAKLDLSYCTIVAPVGGRTSATSRYVGDLVRSQMTEPLVTVIPSDPLWVEFTAVSADLPALRSQLGRTDPGIDISLPGGSWSRTGRIVFLDNTVDANSAMLSVRAEIANADGALLPGTYVDARFRQSVVENAVLVPIQSIVRKAAASVVWVVQDDSTVKMRTVELGPRQGEDVVVASGLKSGERVVTEGQAKLRDGAKVEVVSSSGATSSNVGAGAGDGT